MRRTKGVSLGSIGGVPLRITAGWALIAVVMMIAFTPVVQNYLALPMAPAAGVALTIPVLLAVSVLIHELAHGVTAQKLGYQVREYVITLWGGHTTFMSEIDRPGASAGVACAGPAANVVLAAAGWWMSPHLGPIAAFVTLTLALTNAFVAVFNLLPASPLDGGKILEALIWKITGNRWFGMRVAGRLGQVSAVVVALGFVAWPYLTGSNSTVTVITGVIVAMVMWQGAQQTVKTAQVRQASEDFSLEPYTQPAVVVEGHTPVSHVDTLPAFVLVRKGNQPQYYPIDADAWRAVPTQQRPVTPVSAVHTSMPVRVVRHAGGSQAVSEIASGLNAGVRLFLYQPHHSVDPTQVGLINIDGVLAELKRRGA